MRPLRSKIKISRVLTSKIPHLTLDLKTAPPLAFAVLFGAIAQLGERNTGSVEVCGSIPHGSTRFVLFSPILVHFQALVGADQW